VNRKSNPFGAKWVGAPGKAKAQPDADGDAVRTPAAVVWRRRHRRGLGGQGALSEKLSGRRGAELTSPITPKLKPAASFFAKKSV
jgi:hypothetical protein